MTFWTCYWFAFVACLVFSIPALGAANEEEDCYGGYIEGECKNGIKRITIGNVMLYLVGSLIPIVNFLVAIVAFSMTLRFIFITLCDLSEKPVMQKKLFGKKRNNYDVY